MTQSQSTWRDAPAAVLAMIDAVEKSGSSVTRVKLAKLLYLADLRAVELANSPRSGLTWKWLNYGPYDGSLKSIEETLVQHGDIEVISSTNFYGSPEYRLTLRHAPQLEIDVVFAEIVREIADEFGLYSPTTLKDMTYETPPMLMAQAGGRRGVLLDLTAERPVPDMESALSKYKKILQSKRPRETAPEAMDDLVHDVSSTSYLRARANDALLD